MAAFADRALSPDELDKSKINVANAMASYHSRNRKDCQGPNYTRQQRSSNLHLLRI